MTSSSAVRRASRVLGAAVVASVLLSGGALRAQTGSLVYGYEVGDLECTLMTERADTTVGDFRVIKESQFWNRWRVLARSPDSVTLEFRTDAFRISQHSDEGAISYDSRVDPHPHPDLGIQFFRRAAAVGRDIEVVITPEGRVVSVDVGNTAALQERLEELRALAGLPADLEEDEQFYLQFEVDGETNTHKWQWHWPVLSGRPPHVGASWEVEAERPTFFDGRVEQTLHYQVLSLEEGGMTRLGVVDSSRFVFPPGVERFLSVESFNTPGVVLFDVDDGVVLEASWRIDATARLRNIDDPLSGWRPTVLHVAISTVRLEQCP